MILQIHLFGVGVHVPGVGDVIIRMLSEKMIEQSNWHNKWQLTEAIFLHRLS